MLGLLSERERLPGDLCHRISTSSSAFFIERMARTRELEGHHECVNSATFSEDGGLVLTGSDDLMINLYSVNENFRLLKSIRTIHTNNIFCVRDMPLSGGSRILSSAADGRVVITEPGSSSSGELIHRHRGPANRVEIIPGEPHNFYSASEDSKCIAYDLRVDGKKSATVRIMNSGQPSALYGMSVNPFKPYEVILGGDSQFVCMIDFRNPTKGPVGVMAPLRVIQQPVQVKKPDLFEMNQALYYSTIRLRARRQLDCSTTIRGERFLCRIMTRTFTH